MCILRVLNQLNQHFGVGLAAERHTVFLHLNAQRLVVFNDAVVDKCQVFGLRVVRVGIGGVGLAVGGPACVGNTYGSAYVFVLYRGFQCGDLAFGFVDVQIALGVNH